MHLPPIAFPRFIARRVSAMNRHRKWRIFMEQIRPTPDLRVLDVGFTVKENNPTANYIEKHYPYPERLVALGIDPVDEFASRYPQVRAVQYDGKAFPFEDGEFDVCWSNAVLEHAGDAARQIALIREMKRVAERLFLTTPNRRFPIEIHTRTPLLHYLPRSLFHGYLRLVGKDWATGDYMNLVTERELRALLRAGGVVDYRLLKNRIMGLAVDFIVVADHRPKEGTAQASLHGRHP